MEQQQPAIPESHKINIYLSGEVRHPMRALLEQQARESDLFYVAGVHDPKFTYGLVCVYDERKRLINSTMVKYDSKLSPGKLAGHVRQLGVANFRQAEGKLWQVLEPTSERFTDQKDVIVLKLSRGNRRPVTSYIAK